MNLPSCEVGRYIVKYLPGHPGVIARNMPGAGSLVAGNWAYNLAPHDGTVLVLLSPTIPLDEKLGTPNIKFESDKFAPKRRDDVSLPLMRMRQCERLRKSIDAAAGSQQRTVIRLPVPLRPAGYGNPAASA